MAEQKLARSRWRRLARGMRRASGVGRIPRSYLVTDESTNHCTWQAHNFDLVFEFPGARDKFLSLIGKYKARYGILLRSYCLMGTHPHVVCTSDEGQKAFSGFWRTVNGNFAKWFNRQQGRRGQVVMERLRSPRIQEKGGHLLVVMRYGDLNPVRAGLVRSPKDWKWSSYRHYAFGEANELIDDAAEYLALGRTGPERRKAYQALFAGRVGKPLKETREELVVGRFIGEPEWVEEQEERCREEGKRRRP